MMSEMGKKKNVKIFSAVIAAIFVLSVAGVAVMQMGNPVNAAPSSNIGVVDMSKVIPPDNQAITDAQKEMQQASQDAQKQFEEQSANMTDEQRQQLFSQMQDELAKKQETIYKGVKDKVDDAVGSVASTKGLSIVIDKRAVLYGGQDITEQVSKKLSESQPAASGSSSSSSQSSDSTQSK